MKDQYQPPCTFSPEILKYAADISEQIVRLSVKEVNIATPEVTPEVRKLLTVVKSDMSRA
jgi:hypothetical protein